MIKSLLLTVDGSNYTESVIKYGMTIAALFDIPIRLLHVIDIRMTEWAVTIGTEGFAPIVPSNLYKKESQKLLDDRAKKILQKATKILGDNGCDFKTETIAGAPSEIICEKAKLVDLVVMGQRGEFAKWETRKMGATLTTVSRECNKPIFVVPQIFKKIVKILAPYDGSNHSNCALQLTGYIANRMNIKVNLLTVSDDEISARVILNEGEEYLKTYGIKPTTFRKEGDVNHQIILHTKESGCNLIIMGAYGHSRIVEAILGSTTIQVMSNVDTPVILVK